MNKVASLVVLLSLSFILVSAQNTPFVNKLAVFPFRVQTEVPKGQERISYNLAHKIIQRLAAKNIYSLYSLEDLAKSMKRDKMSLNQWYNLENRLDNMEWAQSYFRFLVEGEILFRPDSSIVIVNARLVQSENGQVFQSAAISGPSSDLSNLAQLISQKIVPSSETLLLQISQDYQKSYAEKQFQMTIDLCNWALEINPKNWQHHYQRGKALEALGASIKAFDDYQKAMAFKGSGSEEIELSLKNVSRGAEQTRATHSQLLHDLAIENQKLQSSEGSFLKAQLITEIIQEMKDSPEISLDSLKASLQDLQKRISQWNQHFNSAQRSTPNQENNQNLSQLMSLSKEISTQTKELVTSLQKNHSQLASLHLKKAISYNKNKQEEKVFREVSKALLLNENLSQSHYFKGILLGKSENYPGADQSFTKAIENKPDYWEAYYNRGLTQIKLKDWTKALSDFQKTSQINPEYPLAYFYSGEVYLTLAQTQKAIENYNKALQYQPDLAEAYQQRGKIYDNQQNYQKAYDDYQQAYKWGRDLRISLSPLIEKTASLIKKDGLIYLERGLSFQSYGENEEALSCYNQVLTLIPNSAQAHYYRGLLYSSQGETSSALIDLNRAIELDNQKAEYFLQRAIIFGKEGNHQEALENISSGLQKQSGFHQAYFYRGYLYEKMALQTKTEEEKNSFLKTALNEYSSAIQLLPSKAHYYFARAHVYNLLGKEKEAKLDRVQAREIKQ